MYILSWNFCCDNYVYVHQRFVVYYICRLEDKTETWIFTKTNAFFSGCPHE